MFCVFYLQLYFCIPTIFTSQYVFVYSIYNYINIFLHPLTVNMYLCIPPTTIFMYSYNLDVFVYSTYNYISEFLQPLTVNMSSCILSATMFLYFYNLEQWLNSGICIRVV